MAIVTASGTKVYIGAAVTQAQADTLAEFQAMTGWQEIHEVESVGEFGDQAADVTFASLGDGRVRHAKGARDAGTMAVVCGHDPLDAGQQAATVAETTNDDFAFRVVPPDGPAGMSDSEWFFRGLVASARKNVGANDNIIRTTFNVLISSEIFTQEPATI
jgi:hypothetical protein